MRLNEHPSIYESGNQLNTQISEHTRTQNWIDKQTELSQAYIEVFWILAVEKQPRAAATM